MRSAVLVVRLDFGSGDQLDFLGDLAGSIDLDQPAGAAFHDEHAPVGERLAGMDFGLLRRFVFPHDLFVGRNLDGSAEEAEQIISVCQPPTVLGRLASKLPLDFPLCRDDADLPPVVIAAEKRMSRLQGDAR